MKTSAIFASSLLLFAFLSGCTEKKTETIDSRPLVRIGSVSNAVEFTDALDVQGMIRAKNVATVAARVPGTVDEMLVDEGLSVRRGQPLFRIDRVNLANAVRAAKDDLAMAKAKLAQAEAVVAKAKLDVERMTRLLKDGAVTKDMFEKADVAAKSHAAACDAAKATLTKAETGLAVAEKNFADSEVKAPFDGIITKKHKNAGDFCSPGAKVFDLEDTSRYEVCMSLNAAQYGRIIAGKTEVEVGGQGRTTDPHDPNPNQTIKQSNNQTIPISYKSPSVNPLTRTFEVRATIEKTSAIAAGMLVDCRVIFSRRRSQAVPATAVAMRGGGGDCVFAVRDGRTVRIPVQAGISADGRREILAPTISPTEQIVVEGQLLINEGTEVRTVK